MISRLYTQKSESWIHVYQLQTKHTATHTHTHMDGNLRSGNASQNLCQTITDITKMMSDHWVGYQNLEPFVWLVLIDQFPDMCSVYWSRFPELCLIKTSETKRFWIWYPTQCDRET